MHKHMNIDKILNWPFQEIVQTYTTHDTLFYALSVGYGSDPMDRQQLQYVYEDGLIASPSMAVVLGHPGPWGANPETGINIQKVVYAEQSMELHAQLPPKATVRAIEKVISIVDKGADKGTLLKTERRIVDDSSDELLATLTATLMCRGNGGTGVTIGVTESPSSKFPDTSPDRVAEMATLPQSALIYRLNGDMNPLHADPAVANAAGFERPILHGLCSFGVATHAILKLWCDYDSKRLVKFSARFTSPVYPGETLRVDTWRDGDVIVFRAWAKERGVKVLDIGVAVVKPEPAQIQSNS